MAFTSNPTDLAGVYTAIGIGALASMQSLLWLCIAANDLELRTKVTPASLIAVSMASSIAFVVVLLKVEGSSLHVLSTLTLSNIALEVKAPDLWLIHTYQV